MKRPAIDPSQNLENRFWAKVDRQGPDDCWSWTGAKTNAGYGKIAQDRVSKGPTKTILATHVALLFDGSPRPSTKHLALHSCDNPSCVNPGHLRWGTHKANFADMADRDRNPRLVPFYKKQRTAYAKMDVAAGTLQLNKQNGKLTAADVIEIRQSTKSVLELATQFGVSRRSITNILKGISWSNV
jgi:hypothetical protein